MQGRTKAFLLVCGSIAIVGSALAVPSQRYGPYVCTACQIATPLPDAATRAYIDSIRTLVEIPFIERTWIICNASYCADYTPTDGDRWFENTYEGRNRERRESGGGGREGGGGGGSSPGGTGGSSPGGIRGGFRGPGVVIVKDPKPV